MDMPLDDRKEEALMAQRLVRFNHDAVAAKLKALRDARNELRQTLIDQGVISDPKKPTTLEGAKQFVGTCTKMCPDDEREERELQNNLHKYEVIPGTKRADPAKTVKIYHRSSAGDEEPLPSDVRTPETLLKTLDYLMNVVVAGDQTLENCHGFVRDRTRAIRVDFTQQNACSRESVIAHERIARFHIVSLHVLCGNKDFDEHQDMEQLHKTLKTLIEVYEDLRAEGLECPNEAEFTAYYIVSQLHDSDAKRMADQLPLQIFLTPIVQQALKLHRLSQTSNEIVNKQLPPNLFGAQIQTTQFFRTVASAETPLLLACLAEYEFPRIRRAGLKAMNSAFPHQKGREYPLDEFADIFAFDGLNDAKEFCALFNVPVNEGGVMLGAKVDKRLTYREPARRAKRVRRNLRVVGVKFQSATPIQVINSDLDPGFLQPHPMRRALANAAVAKSQAPVPPKAVAAPVKTAAAPVPSKVQFAVPKVPAPKAVPNPAPTKVEQPVALSTPNAFASNHSNIFQTSKRSELKPQKERTKPVSEQLPPISPFSNAMVKPVTAPALKSSSLSAPQSAPQSLFAPPKQPADTSTADPSTAPAKPDVPVFTPTPAMKPAFSMPVAPTPQPEASKVTEITWNKPRRFIHWTMLSNAILDNMLESIVRDIAAPELDRSRANERIAAQLAEDIASSLTDYTTAFIAYEVAYREVMTAKADAFRKRALVSTVFSQWQMGVTAREQEAALRQQYIDDLKTIIDSAPALQPPRSLLSRQPMMISPAHSRTQSNVSSVSMQSAQAADSTFWDSCQLGRSGFASLTTALEEFGGLPFRAKVGVVGAHGNSLLATGLWWQIDPASATQANSNVGRQASYSNSKAQDLEIADETDEFHVIDRRLYARIALLSQTPVADDIRRDLCDSPAGAEIAANLQALADNLRSGGGPRHTLLVFWTSDSRTGKTVTKLIEKRAKQIGISTMTQLKVAALDLQAPGHQFGRAVGWVFSQLAQAQQALLVTSSSVLTMVKDAVFNSLHLMVGSVCKLATHQSSNELDVQVFNWTVDIVNSYLQILNSRLLAKWARLPKLSTYAHVDESQGELRAEYFFHSMPALGAVAGAALDDIFQACALGQISPLVAHLRALEFTTRHQLDLLQQRMPSDLYLERTLVDSEIADAKLTAQQSADQAADLCRQGAMVVESPPASVISMQSVPSLKRTQCCSEFAEPPLPIIAEDIDRSTLSVKRTRLAASARLSRLQEALARAHQQLQ